MALSPVNGAVLGTAALVVSPALWLAVEGSLPVDVALSRYLVAVPLCWIALNVLVQFFLPHPEEPEARTEDETLASAPSSTP